MAGRLITAAIALFWLTMMGMLLHKEIIPTIVEAREMARTPNYAQLTIRAGQPRTEQMGIYLGEQLDGSPGKRIGFTRTKIVKVEDEIQMSNRSELKLDTGTGRLALGGEDAVDIRTQFDARIGEGRLRDFRLVLRMGPGEPVAIIDGFPIGDDMTLRIHQGSQTHTETIPFDSRQVISSAFMPAFTPERMRVGESWPIHSIDMQTMSIRKAQAQVVGRDQLIVAGRAYDAYRIEIPYGPSPDQVFRVWASPQGDVLKQKVFGFILLREEPVESKDVTAHD